MFFVNTVSPLDCRALIHQTSELSNFVLSVVFGVTIGNFLLDVYSVLVAFRFVAK